MTVNIGAGDTTLPNVSITSPANGTTYTSAQTVTVTASASDNVGVSSVQFRRNGVLVRTDSTAPYTASWSVSESLNGSHAWTARAFDAAGNSRTSSTVNTTVNISSGDTTLPNVSITSPANGTTYTSAQNVTVTASASDNVGVTSVQFRRNGVLIKTDTSAPYTASWYVDESQNGSRSWTARAYDAAGNSRTSSTVNTTVNIGAGELGDPELVGFIPGMGAAMDVAVDGAEAFVASEDFGLSVLYVSSSSTPELLGSSDVPFIGDHVAVVGSTAVVAGETDAGKAHLWVLGVSNATSPQILGELTTALTPSLTSGFLDIALNGAGTLAIGAMGSSGIWVIDVSNRANPVVVGTYNTPGTAHAVAVDGTRAYVADGTGDLLILSFSNASQPSFVGSMSISGYQQAIDVAGGWAYLASSGGALSVVDVSTPSSPSWRGSAPISGSGREVAVSGSRLAVFSTASGGNVVDILNVSTPSTPQILGQLDLVDGRGVGIAAGFAYAADGSDGLKIYDVQPFTPSPDGAYMDPFEGSAIDASGGVAVVAGEEVATGKAILRVVDAAASEPRVLGELTTNLTSSLTSGFLDVELDGGQTLAIAAMGSSGVWVIDVSNRSNPYVRGSYNTPGTAHSVAVNGTHAYVADGTGDLQVLSFANPGQPSLVGSLSVSGYQQGIAVLGGWAYLASSGGALSVVDVSTPSSPSWRGSIPLSGSGRQVQADGSRVAVFATASGGNVVDILDVSNPAVPEDLGQLDLVDGQGVELSGGYAYAADGTEGLKIYDVSGAAPVFVTSVATAGDAMDVAVDGLEACVADSKATLDVIDLAP
jgi:hypothetical protein